MRKSKTFLLLFCCTLIFETRGQFSLFGGKGNAKPANPPKSSQPLVVLPDHLKEDDDFHKMKQEINEGLGPKIDPNSYQEASVLRGQIQQAQLSGPEKTNLNALGGSKVKKPSGRVGSSQVDPILASTDTETVESHPVVLPTHLMEKGDSHHMKQDMELQIDPNSFYEAAVIREKIQESQMQDHSQQMSHLGGSQSSPYHRLGSSQNETDSSLNHEPLLLNKNIYTNKEYYGATGTLSQHKPLFNKSKIVWHQNVAHKGKHLRDLLTLKKVAVNVNFIIGEGADIEVWKAFRKFSNKHSLTLIAMTNNGLLLVQEQSGTFEVLQEISMKERTVYVELFEKWDDTSNSWIGVVIVSTPGQIIWYETKDDHIRLEEVWRWYVHKTMVQVKYFRYRSTDLLMLVNEGVPSSADIYEFDYFRKTFWIAQVINLEYPSTSVGILRHGEVFLICFPQKDHVLVYEYQKTVFEHGRLTLKETLDAHGVTMVVGFSVGGYTYLAIGGPTSKILKYTEDSGFVQQVIKGDQLENVVHWLPIHVHTYRDDLLLLALREMNLQTHVALDIKGVIWDLESFRVTPNIPCHDDEPDLTKGLTCILDPYRKEGLWGSGFVQHHDHLTLVIPQNEAPSALYDLFYEIVPAPDPIVQELEKIEATYELLADIVEYQDLVVENALETISHALNTETDNYVTGVWEISHLGAKEVIQSDNVKWGHDQIRFGEQTWTSYDQRLDLATLDEYLAKTEAELDYISGEVSFNRPLRYSDNPLYPINAVANGKFDINSINVLYPTHPSKPSTSQNYDQSRNKRHLKVSGPVEFDELEVQELVVKNINGIPATDITFVDDPVLELKGPLIFEKVVSVDEITLNHEGKVNGIDLDRQLIHFTNPITIKSPLKFDTLEAIGEIEAQHINPKVPDESKFKSDDTKVLKVEKLEITGNINAKNINGRDWDELVSNIVPKNLPTAIEKLTVDGTVFVDHTNVDVVHVNNLNFVNDLVFGTSQDSYVQITGKKSFKSGLFAQQIDCETLDGIYTPDVITLTDYQTIPGKTIFTSLEVSDDLEVNGKIQGEKLDDFEENLTLLESRIVEASTIFEYLRVDGPIKIVDTFNGITIDEALGNVIYTDGTKVEVNSYKYFKNADFEEGIHIKSGLLNGIDTKDIVTKSTEQTLEFNELEGDVLFQRLELGGLFDFINVTELDMNAVKLTGDQYSEISMSIANPVKAKSLKIEKELNGHTLNDFYRIDHELNLKGDIVFNELLIDQGHVSGGIHTNGYLNGINLKEFDQTRLSLTRPQHLLAPCHIKDVTIHGNLRNEIINQVPTSSFTNNVLKAQSVRNLLYSGEILIDNLYVDKNVAIKSLNGVNLNHVLENVVWLNRPSTIYGDLRFVDPVTVTGNVNYGELLNGEHFERFVDDLVLKNQEVIYLKGVKGFPNGFHVATDVDTEYINDVEARDVVRKDGSVACQGHVTVHGSVDVRHLVIDGTLNNVSLHTLPSLYNYDEQNDKHIIKGDVSFSENVQIDHLHTHGSFNSIPDITSYIYSIIRDDKDCNITGRKSFLNIAFFDQGLDIHRFNDLSLSDLAKDIVLINPTEKTVINGLVSFQEPVFAPSTHIHGDIATHNIADCSPQEWVYNGLLTNKHEKILTSLKFKSEHLTSPSFLAVNLNGKPIDDIVTLHTAQHFSSSLSVNELYLTGAIHVGGTVNRVKLPYAKENTLMTYGAQQHIATYATAFQSLRVLQGLTLDHLNGVSTSNIATLQDDLYFESPLEFKSITVPSLKTEDLISGINFNHWCDHSLISNGNSPQKVHKNWTIDELTLESDMTGNGLINQVKVDDIVQSIAKSKASTDEVIVGVAHEYQDMCHNIKVMSENAKSGIYFFKYFEQKFELTSGSKMYTSRYFQLGHDQFMLLNSGCMSDIYHWSVPSQTFVKVDQVNTGHVSEVKVFKNDSLLILTSHSNNCDVKGLSLFKIDASKLVLVSTLKENVVSVHTISHSSTFFGLIENTRVLEYDSSFHQIEEWLLPETTSVYRFLPFDLGIGLALSDGRTVVALTSMRSDQRSKRQIPESINLQDLHIDGNVEYGYGDSEIAVGEADFEHAEWRKYDYGSSTAPPFNSIVYHTINPPQTTTSYHDYDYNEERPKLSDILKQQAAADLYKTSTLPPDYYDPSISPGWKYLHKENDVIQANIDSYKPKDLPELPSEDETHFQESLREVVADVNRKIDILKDMIVTTPINNLTQLPNINFAILSNFETPFSVVRFGRTPSPDDYSEVTVQSKDEFGDFMRQEFAMWNEATQNLKDVLMKIDEMKSLDPIVAQTHVPETTSQLPSLQSSSETQFTNNLRDLVSKWNKKGSELQSSLKDTQINDTLDPMLTQVQELKDVMIKLPALQSTDEKQFNDQIRGLVAKWNEKVSELKSALDGTRYDKSHEEPILTQTKVLEDLIKTQLPELQSPGEKDFGNEIRSLVAEWNKKANALENVIKSTKKKTELEPILTKTNELRPFMIKLPSLQSKNEQEFNDQLRTAIGKWNEASSKLKEVLEGVSGDTMLGKEQIEASTVPIDASTIPAIQSTSERQLSDQLREQLSKWNEIKEKIKEKSTTKIESTTQVIPFVAQTTEELRLALTEAPVTIIPCRDTTVSPFSPTVSSPDDVQMIPDLKKTFFVEQTDVSSTVDPNNRFIAYETTPMPGVDQVSTTEPTVGQAIPVGGVKTMENFYLPAKDKGEIVLLNVGIHGMQRKLIAISSVVNKRSTIPGQHDVIQIYDDIYEGKLFQTIPCYQPSGLSVIHLRDETLLTFLEGSSGVRVYAYRGIQGFVQISNFNLPRTAHRMEHVQLNQEIDDVHQCATNYLSVTTDTDVIFYQAKTEPEKNCQVKASLKCD